MKRIQQVKKRDGRLVPFDLRRVADAIYRAAGLQPREPASS